MRKELYTAIERRLACIEATPGGYIITPFREEAPAESRGVRHIDLWNRNVEFIDQEDAWPRPAVFIEMEPVRWQPLVNGVEYRAEASVRLHIVTDWHSDEGGEARFRQLDLAEAVHAALIGLEGETFKDFDLAESLTNHNHEDIVESIEVYSFVAIKSIEPAEEA